MTVDTFTNFHKSTDPDDIGGLGSGEILARNVINKSFSIDPVSLPNGSFVGLGVGVPGAKFGDYVMVAAPYDLQNIVITGFVQSENSVEITLQNNSGVTVDLGLGDWKIKVIHDGL